MRRVAFPRELLELQARDPEAFSREFRMQCRVLDDGRLYGEAFEPWQEEFLFVPISQGKNAYIELPRGHDKTGAVAWISIEWLIFGDPEQSIIVAAADKEQAQILLTDLDAQVRRVPALQKMLKVKTYEVVFPEKHSRLKVIPADAGSSYGLKPTRLIIEELHAWAGSSAVELKDSLWGSIAKRRAQVVVITNAGTGRDWKWQFREAFRAEAGEDPERWHFYSAPGWVAKFSEKEKRRLELGMHPLSRRRFIENEWLEEAEGAFCTTAQAWDCVVNYDPMAIARPPLVAQGIDLGLTHDAAVVSVVGMDYDGACSLLSMHVFPGSKEDPVLIEAVEEVAKANMASWQPLATAIDPWQAASTIQRIGPALRAEEFTFSTRRLQELTDALWQRVSSTRLRFWPGAGRAVQKGEDWDLHRELKEAVVKETTYGSRIDHRAGGYSDRLISMGMAIWRLAQETLAPAMCVSEEAPEVEGGSRAEVVAAVKRQIAEALAREKGESAAVAVRGRGLKGRRPGYGRRARQRVRRAIDRGREQLEELEGEG
jgi:hypothetical protein